MPVPLTNWIEPVLPFRTAPLSEAIPVEPIPFMTICPWLVLVPCVVYMPVPLRVKVILPVAALVAEAEFSPYMP